MLALYQVSPGRKLYWSYILYSLLARQRNLPTFTCSRKSDVEIQCGYKKIVISYPYFKTAKQNRCMAVSLFTSTVITCPLLNITGSAYTLSILLSTGLYCIFKFLSFSLCNLESRLVTCAYWRLNELDLLCNPSKSTHWLPFSPIALIGCLF